MVIKSAKFEEYVINIMEDSSVEVLKNGEKSPNTVSELRAISKKINFAYEDAWNTRQFGKKMVEYLSEDNMAMEKQTECSKDEIINDIRNVISKIILVLKGEEKESKTKKNICSYIQQRGLINTLFEQTSKEYNDQPINSILLRLIVLDSLYSTNASYSYFSFDNMAKAIKSLGNEKDAIKYFYELTLGKNIDEKQLFSSKYGIRKNLSEGSLQMSLMSKYAYYQLMQYKQSYPLGFPIYDSLAVTMYPKVYNLIFGKEDKIKDNTSIGDYIQSLNKLRKKIFIDDDNPILINFQQYDLLDAYLWRMGKINEGNFSLLFNEDDYKKIINNLELSVTEKDKFDEYIYNKFKSIYYEGKELVSKNKKTNMNNQKKTIYTYDFNRLVKYQCSIMKVEDILRDIKNNEYLNLMIEHWKKYYMSK